MSRIRLETLLGAAVTDADGEHVGVVHDARFTADGPPLASGRPAYRLTALICGPVTVGTRLGYGGGVHGPWPFGHVFRFLGRHSRLVAWDQVDSFDEGQVRLKVPHDHLKPLPTTESKRRAHDHDSGRKR